MVEEDIKLALDFIYSDRIFSTDVWHMQVFTWTNEALYLYFPFYIKENSEVLTVASSGDQVLQAIFNGAKSVTAFDRNKFTYYYTALKMAGVKYLSFEEFMEYFTTSMYPRWLYDKLKNGLDDDVTSFIDAVIYNRDKGNLSKLFIPCDFWANEGEKSYLNKDNYYILQKILLEKDIKYEFIHCNVLDLKEELSRLSERKYDTVIFSNIYDWLSPFSGERETFNDLLESGLRPYLKDKASIVAFSTLSNVRWQETYDFSPIEEYVDIKNNNSAKVYVLKRNDIKG